MNRHDSLQSTGGTTSSLRAIFCPHHGLVGTARSRVAAETAALLRNRLLAICVFLDVVLALFLVRSLFVDGFGLLKVEEGLVLGIVVLATVLVARRPGWSLAELRVTELVLMSVMVGHLLFANALVTVTFVELGDPVSATTSIYRCVMAIFGLVVLYGTFIPNTWPRAALVSSVAAVSPVVMFTWLVRTRPAVQAAFDSHVDFNDVSFSGLFLVVGVLLAGFGAHIIHSIRHAAARQEEMGMYRLREKIGAGGMGEVWKAEHRMLSRPAAIKMVRPGAADDGDALATLTSRFEREARATASLTSPHTIQLYDFGVTSEGLFYYVMEYLEGIDMKSLVELHGPLAPARVVHLLRQAAESLEEAHSVGLIHRDIKPSNLHLCRRGIRHDFVKVLDFGLVKSSGESGGDPALTREGVATGTPAFMAPEAAMGNRPVDHRSDVYALGCVAYWLLTGRFVFESDSAIELVIKHVQEEPRPPSAITETAVPAALDRLVLRCLAKDPGDRPQSMAEIIEALEECARTNDETWNETRATEWWRLHMQPAVEVEPAA